MRVHQCRRTVVYYSMEHNLERLFPEDRRIHIKKNWIQKGIQNMTEREYLMKRMLNINAIYLNVDN